MTRSTKLCSYFLVAASLLGTTSLAFAQSGNCKDPWIKMVYNSVYKRNPSDPSNNGVSGECNIMLYGNGHWSNYQDLTNKVIAHTGAPPSAQAAPASITFHLDRSYNVVDSHGSVFATNGAYRLIGQDGNGLTAAQIASIVAQGGGNIILNGGGNIVAQGGGNYRLQSTSGPLVFRLR